MIVRSSSLVLPSTAYPLNYPVVGYENLATASNLSATTEQEGYPASNMGNPSTALLWRSDVLESPMQHVFVLTCTFDAERVVDYLAIARHNFGTIGALLGVDVLENTSPDGWEEVVQTGAYGTDETMIFQFTPVMCSAVRLRIQLTNDPAIPPYCGVFYCGSLLQFERGVQGGWAPPPYGRVPNVSTGTSENGNFLGRIVTGGTIEAVASFIGLSPAWARASLDPFLENAMQAPFFFAWNPRDYPNETGYFWFRDQPQPSFDIDGLVSVDLNMAGLVE